MGKIRSKIEILCTHYLLCQKFATVCQNYIGDF